jgi:DNA-binding response OmpR family regulator
MRVLVIEDDPDIRRSLQVVLRRGGYELIGAEDGNAGLTRFSAEQPDVVVLDVGLPGIDGWTVLERIRSVSQVPVLMLTARGLETDKARGLLGGADDYLVKPYSNGELVARLNALLRYSKKRETNAPVFDDGYLKMDFSSGITQREGQTVVLTPIEFRLLSTLVRHAGQALSTRRLLSLVWNDAGDTDTGKVKFSIHSLRKKMGWENVKRCPVENVRGFGYRYRRPD